MAQSRRKPAITADPDGTPPAATIRQALDDVGIDKPYYTCKVVGSRLEFSLYGGDVVTWPPAPPRRKR